MELKIDLNAPPHMLMAAHDMLGHFINGLPGAHLGVGTASAAGPLLGESIGSQGADIKPPPPPAPSPSPSPSPADSRVDMHGVAFDPTYCADAEEPFYSSGPRKGQWKKRRGVDEGDYDGWYAARRAAADAARPLAEEPREERRVDTSAAFGSAGTTGKQSGRSLFEADTTPQTTGELMVWVSEKQAAQRLLQADIDAAYQTAGVVVQDMFPPNDAATIKRHVATIYQLLAAKAGA